MKKTGGKKGLLPCRFPWTYEKRLQPCRSFGHFREASKLANIRKCKVKLKGGANLGEWEGKGKKDASTDWIKSLLRQPKEEGDRLLIKTALPGKRKKRSQTRPYKGMGTLGG